jgi:uncharacterized membrane protein HdeD (DUF308 family)
MNGLKIGGVVAVVAGTVALFVTGVGTSAITAIVAAVVVAAGLIASLFRVEAKVE